MLHIRPVPEEKAPDSVKELYKDIKQTFHIEIVPLLFQYLAGFEEYFFYVWEKIKQNVESKYFQDAASEIVAFSQDAIREIYTPSYHMEQFASHLHEVEKHHIAQTIHTLARLNADLFLLTVGMREDLKGVNIGAHLLAKHATDEVIASEVFDQFINSQIMRQNITNQDGLEHASKMLAPLFGGSDLMVSKYPEFFARVAEEMDNLVKDELYLSSRVGLEHIGMLTVRNLPYPLGTSYQEIARFAGTKPYFDELLYILSESFPTRFPRLVFTTGLMSHVLVGKTGSLAIQ